MRLLAVVVGLMVLDLALPLGVSELWKRWRPSGRYLLMFDNGWDQVPILVLAVWLTWGPGRLAYRLLSVLSLLLIFVGAVIYTNRHKLEDSASLHLGAILFVVAQVMSVHALAFPLRTVVERRSSQQWQWSLTDVISCTAFVAIALAMIRLHNINRSETSGPGNYWFDLAARTAPGLACMPLIAWAVWRPRASVMWRVFAVLLAIAAAWCAEQCLLLAFPGPRRLTDWLFSALGIATATLVHFAALRSIGIVWSRQVREPLSAEA